MEGADNDLKSVLALEALLSEKQRNAEKKASEIVADAVARAGLISEEIKKATEEYSALKQSNLNKELAEFKRKSEEKVSRAKKLYMDRCSSIEEKLLSKYVKYLEGYDQ